MICSRLTREIYKCQTVLAPNPELQDGKKEWEELRREINGAKERERATTMEKERAWALMGTMGNSAVGTKNNWAK